MLRWAVMYLFIALIDALVGFTEMAGTAYVGAKILFVVFLVLAMLTLACGGEHE